MFTAGNNHLIRAGFKRTNSSNIIDLKQQLEKKSRYQDSRSVDILANSNEFKPIYGGFDIPFSVPFVMFLE